MLTPHYPPRHGGLADYCRRLSYELLDADVEVFVISKDGRRGDDPFPVESFPGPWTPRSYRRLKASVTRHAPDVIVLQYGGPYAFNRWGPGLPVASLVAAVSRACQVPLVTYGHELYVPWRHSWARTPIHLTQRLATALLIAASRSFVVTIASRETRLRRLFPWWRHKIHKVPIAPTLDQESVEPGWRTRHGIAPATFLVAAMGVDDPTKGAAALGPIADQLEASGRDVRVVAVGGLRSEHPKVEAWGYVDAHDAWNLISAADLFVLPFADGVSTRRTTALNGLAAGAAMLTTLGVDTDRDLFSSAAVALVPAGDPGAFANAAVQLSTDPERLASLRTSGRKLSADQFGWATHVESWLQILRVASRR